MKQIDLGPDDYKAKGPDGRWRVRDDPRVLAAGVVVGLLWVIGIWWFREDLSSGLAIAATAMFAFAAGIGFGLLTKDWH